MQLNPRALLALSRPLLEGFERDFTPRLWHGLRLLAIDGSTARLPNTDDAMATFGVPPEEGSSVPLARFFGERVLAGEHLAARNNVASVPGCCWLYSREVSAFVASGKNSEAVLFTPGPHARQHCQTYGLATDPIPLRLIRVKLNKRRT